MIFRISKIEAVSQGSFSFFVRALSSLPFVLMFFVLMSCGVTHRFMATDQSREDTSFVYKLPYPKGVSHLMLQGYNSRFSHKGRMSLDFKMKEGSPVAAARSGVIIQVEESFSEGGISKKHLRKANLVIVRHNDGTEAMYAHLAHNGVLPVVGDTVRTGQVIAKSGSTGYSALPHLHFYVWERTPKGRTSIPTRFKTKQGAKYLRPGRWYRAQ